MDHLSQNGSNLNLKIVSTEMKPTGEAVQLVRPLVATTKSTDQIVGDLVNRFSYKTNDVKASENELNAVHQAFGLNLAKELIKTYDGSNLVSDSQQDLIGERYLAEQIRLIQEQQKTTSILDKWSHLLYEGENDYRSSPDQQKTTQIESYRGASHHGGSNSHYSLLHQNHQQHIQTGSCSPQSRLSGNLTSNSNQRFLAHMLSQAQSGLVSNSNGHMNQSRLISESNAQFQSGLQSRTLSQVKIQETQMDYESQLRELAQLRAIEEARQLANAVSSASLKFQSKYHHSYELQQQQADADQQSVYQQAVDQNSVYQPSVDQSLYEQSVGQNDDYQTAKYDELQFAAINVTNDINDESLQQDIISNHQKASTHSFKSSKIKMSSDQPNSYLPRLSNSQINAVNIEDYNTPQFKAMLDQLLKPIILPPEHVNYPADWPSQDKINLLAEPIYIPAPQPIVIPAPNIITMQGNNFDDVNLHKLDLPEDVVKSKVTYYPSINSDQENFNTFGIRQINLNSNLARTGSNLVINADN